MIRRFAMLAPDLEVAHFYNLVNSMRIINRNGPDVEITDPVEVFNLYRPALPGRFVPIDLEDDVLCVEALGLENGEGTHVFLLNRSASESAQVTLDGFAVDKAGSICLQGESPTGVFSRTERKLSGDAVELPPLSITRVVA